MYDKNKKFYFWISFKIGLTVLRNPVYKANPQLH